MKRPMKNVDAKDVSAFGMAEPFFCRGCDWLRYKESDLTPYCVLSHSIEQFRHGGCSNKRII